MFLWHTTKIFKDEIVFLMNMILLNCLLFAGLEILAFLCNQLGGQERGSNPEIKQFACTRFKAEFPIFDKGCHMHCSSLYILHNVLRAVLRYHKLCTTGWCQWAKYSSSLPVPEIECWRVFRWSYKVEFWKVLGGQKW